MVSQERMDLICNQLVKIERSDDIKVLLAVESGSRAWGFESDDSDFDVRFVYVQRPSRYLTLFDKKDTRTPSLDDPDMDFAGWDIRKALQLLAKSNPDLIGWSMSPFQYIVRLSVDKKIYEFARKYFNEKAFGHHNIQVARRTYDSYLEGKAEVVGKKYFYALRPLLNIQYVRMFKAPPPIDFQTLFEAVADKSFTVREESQIFHLLKWKREQGKETNLIPVVPALNQWVKYRIENAENWLADAKGVEDTEGLVTEIDELYRSILKDSESLF